MCVHQFDATLAGVVDSETIKPGPVGEHLAGCLRRIRESRHVTYTELTKRLEQLRHPIPILGLRRIERGERRVDVDDLVALARALHVPPVLLLFPVESADPVVELVPGVVAEPLEALAWFVGDGPPPLGLTADQYDEKFGRGQRDPLTGLHEWYENPDSSWEADAAPVLLRRRHERLVSDWLTSQQIAKRLASDKESSEELNYKLLTLAEDQLRALRGEMRRLGIVPPKLPPALADQIADAGMVTYERVEDGEVVERVVVPRDGREDVRLASSPNWQQANR